MAVVFESRVKLTNDRTSWSIELKDTVDDRIVDCANLEEYQEKMKELSDDYGGNIDEVKWSKDDDVPLHFMDEIRLGMAKIQAEIEEKTGEPLIKDKEK